MTTPTELDRLGVEVGPDSTTGEVYLYLPEPSRGVLGMSPAAALDLAARLREAALKIQAEDENAFTALHGH